MKNYLPLVALSAIFVSSGADASHIPLPELTPENFKKGPFQNSDYQTTKDYKTLYTANGSDSNYFIKPTQKDGKTYYWRSDDAFRAEFPITKVSRISSTTNFFNYADYLVTLESGESFTTSIKLMRIEENDKFGPPIPGASDIPFPEFTPADFTKGKFTYQLTNRSWHSAYEIKPTEANGRTYHWCSQDAFFYDKPPIKEVSRLSQTIDSFLCAAYQVTFESGEQYTTRIRLTEIAMVPTLDVGGIKCILGKQPVPTSGDCQFRHINEIDLQDVANKLFWSIDVYGKLSDIEYIREQRPQDMLPRSQLVRVHPGKEKDTYHLSYSASAWGNSKVTIDFKATTKIDNL